MKFFHSITVLAVAGLLSLAACSDLQENLPEPESGNIQIHPAGWIVKNDPDFHGKILESEGYQLDECTPCHGRTFQGGTSGESCVRSGCHATSEGAEKSPEACNTCHGRFRALAGDTVSWAPPRSLDGDTATASPGVGAHQAHLAGIRLSSNAQCNQCHNIPSELFASGHLGSQPPAELVFDTTLAGRTSADGTFQLDPSYDTLHCGSVYCHGTWRLRRATSPNNWVFTDSIMTGESYIPSWTGGVEEAACGTCHALPPRGHQNLPECSTCHTGVVDASRTIIDRSKHINGRVNIFGTERPL